MHVLCRSYEARPVPQVNGQCSPYPPHHYPLLLRHSSKVVPWLLLWPLRTRPWGMVAPVKDLAAVNCCSVNPLACPRHSLIIADSSWVHGCWIGCGRGRVRLRCPFPFRRGSLPDPPALIHRSAWNRNSRKFACRILHILGPTHPKSPTPGTLLGPAPVPLVTPMDRYACLWMLSYYKH
jgi:hypothetical protein